MRKLVPVVVMSAALLAGACGSSKGSDAASTTTAKTEASTATSAPAGSGSSTTKAPSTTVAPTTAAPTTASPTTAAPTTAAPTTAAAAAASTVNVTLSEWKVEAPAALKAGKVTFNVTNNGQFEHEFVVFKGDFASLPKSANGGVDETKAAPVGRVAKFSGGASASGSFDLAAGTYALICNLGGPGSGHAARGQVLDVVVS